MLSKCLSIVLPSNSNNQAFQFDVVIMYTFFLENTLWLLLHHIYLYDSHISSLSSPISTSYVSSASPFLYMTTLLSHVSDTASIFFFCTGHVPQNIKTSPLLLLSIPDSRLSHAEGLKINCQFIITYSSIDHRTFDEISVILRKIFIDGVGLLCFLV